MPYVAKVDVLVSKQLQEIFKKLESEIEELAEQKMVISLCVFNSEPGSRINYISNGDRKDVAAAWMSMVKGWGEGMPDIPSHDFSG